MFALCALIAAAVALPDTRVESLQSAANGVSYRLYISVPPDFEQRDVHYPAVLLLDADYSFPIAHSIASHLRERRDLPDLLLVGIGYDGPAQYKLNRSRDYTPMPSPGDGYGPEYEAAAGGGPEFLDFIERELVPWLRSHYRAKDRPILVGHSYGGLFALWSLLKRPDRFGGVIAVSPSLWYHADAVLKLASERAATPGSWPAPLYAGVGDLENPRMARGLLSLKRRLAGARKRGLKSKVEVLNGETHNSIFPRALSNGLRFLWPRGTFEPSKAQGTRPPD